MAKKTQKPAMLVVGRLCRTAKWRFLRGLLRILLPVVHLLEELLRLLLVHKGQARQTFLQLERVEKDAVLVVTPCVEDLLVPHNSSVSGRDVHHLQPVRVSDCVIRQHHSALQARVCPFRSVGVCYVESSNGDGLDFVGRLGHEALDGFPVVFAEN